ncbi:tetratricopeptide repeat protein [Leptolyngbya sp. BC1307]|uniref:tetratricopeptide repeat protein n=1 Tax=Leptolyngbya sp. BC1307 TaxID=2029589 RepID=UPI000EFB0247|nr:tetratricopeptide repeat protein [Leptolyngbya sp. BC1307]
METPNFIIWAVVILGIAGFSIGSMVNAYRQPISQAPFPNAAIDQPSTPLASATLAIFVGAVGTCKAGDYRGAIEQFTQVVEQEPGCAEAWHNMGLAYANIGDNNKAVRSLLKASAAYDQQDTKAGIDRIKQELEVLKSID